jgi:NAD(P)-dependent dehydrogenase (short-subunit alcohol dehydrogenase family)
VHPEYLVVVASRSDKENAAKRINQTLLQDNAIFMALDLSSLANIRGFAATWVSMGNPPIQALVLNAGVQHPYGLTKTVDGLEATFAVNHVGHALLFHLLCPCLAQGARIVVTSSGVHDPAKKNGLPDARYETAEQLAHPKGADENLPGRGRYSTSKLVNVLWIYALHRHLQERAPERGITVTAMCPGFMPGTGLGRGYNTVETFIWFKVLPRCIPLLKNILNSNIHTAAVSGQALARLAVGGDVAGVGGKYFEGLEEIKSSQDSYDENKQEDLWSWTINFLSDGNTDAAARLEELK